MPETAPCAIRRLKISRFDLSVLMLSLSIRLTVS
jgi:hypothetical protein